MSGPLANALAVGPLRRAHQYADGRSSSVCEADDRARAAPELLKAVVRSLVGRKDVHDQVAKIEQHPAAVGRAFAVTNVVAFWFQRFFEVIGERVELQRRLRGGDHEVVGERSCSGDIE